MMDEISPKSRLVVTLLAWFLGVFGAHRFYLGKTGTALLMLFTLGGFGIWALVDFILAVAGVMEDKDGRVIKNWEGSTEKRDTSKMDTTITSKPLDIARERYAKGEISKEEFEEKRFEYHKEIEEDFFESYKIESLKMYRVKNGDSIWSLCNEKFEVPFWLIKKYNPNLDFNELHPLQEVNIPVVAPVG